MHAVPQLCSPVDVLGNELAVACNFAVGTDDTLLLACKALVHACQAVGAVQNVFGVLEPQVQVHGHPQWIARDFAKLLVIMTAHGDPTVKGSHAWPVAKHDVTCETLNDELDVYCKVKQPVQHAAVCFN